MGRSLRPPRFFFNDTATTEIYTLSLHDALPIWPRHDPAPHRRLHLRPRVSDAHPHPQPLGSVRSEEHTSELQSRRDLVCRLLLEKKKKITSTPHLTPLLHRCHCSSTVSSARSIL